MINRILPFLNRLLPPALAFKGLQKLDPRIGKFLTVAAGSYGVDGALDFLRDKFQTESSKAGEQRTRSNLGTGNLRPDEEAVYQQVQNSRQIPNLLMNAAKTGAGIAGGAGLAGLGAQALGGLMEGDQAQQIGQQTPSEQQRKEDVPMGSNLLDQFANDYPDIAQAIGNYINNGQSPEVAAAILKQSTPFSQKIKKIERKIGMNFEDYIASLFGQSQQQQPRQNSAQGQQSSSKGLDPQLMQIMSGIRSSIQNIKGNGNQQQQARPQQPQRQNNSDQAIMAALDKILKM